MATPKKPSKPTAKASEPAASAPKPAPSQAAKAPPRPAGGSAKGLLRGMGGMGMVGGSGAMGAGMNAGPTNAAAARDTHSPFNSNAMQAQKAASQNTKANVIQGRKAPGA